jgi:hypothetical protein
MSVSIITNWRSARDWMKMHVRQFRNAVEDTELAKTLDELN